MTNEKKTVMLVGVGGQGLVLFARVLTAGLIRAGYDVKSSEEHGMAQRGGSVVTQISFGPKIYSPVAGEGAVDTLVSLEKLEALRHVHFLKKNGSLLVDEKEIPSLPVITGVQKYPENINDYLSRLAISFHPLQASARAEELGDARVTNMIMLGALVKTLGLTGTVDWPEIVAASVKPQFADLNRKGFAIGTCLV
jgi:indolepyruvate ferredoxin oxidoreductase beta subunit